MKRLSRTSLESILADTLSVIRTGNSSCNMPLIGVLAPYENGKFVLRRTDVDQIGFVSINRADCVHITLDLIRDVRAVKIYTFKTIEEQLEWVLTGEVKSNKIVLSKEELLKYFAAHNYSPFYWYGGIGFRTIEENEVWEFYPGMFNYCGRMPSPDHDWHDDWVIEND